MIRGVGHVSILSWVLVSSGLLLLAVRFFLKSRQTVLRELKRVSKGKVSQQKPLSSHVLEKRLAHLMSSAYEHGTLLGIDRYCGDYVTLSDQAANSHTLVTGVTGAGKTTTLKNIIESVIKRGLPLLYVDGKGDRALLQWVNALATAEQRSFYPFAMVGESLRYNPLAFGGYTSKKDRVVGLRQWSEDHYRILAEGYLQTVLKLLDKAGVSIDLHTLGQYVEPAKLYRLIEPFKNPQWLDEIDWLRQHHKEMGSLLGEIQNMLGSEIGHLFETSHHPTLSIEQTLQQNAVAFFSLPPLRFPAYAETLGKFIINDIKAVVSERLNTPNPKPIYVIVDEFSIFAGEQIIHLINQGRSAGVHAVLATQSLADITKKGGEALLGQVMNNCNNFIIHRQNYPDDAERLANLIGTKPAFEVTSQLAQHQGATGMGTIKTTREYCIHPDEIKRLRVGEAIYLSKQQESVRRIIARLGY